MLILLVFWQYWQLQQNWLLRVTKSTKLCRFVRPVNWSGNGKRWHVAAKSLRPRKSSEDAFLGLPMVCSTFATPSFCTQTVGAIGWLLFAFVCLSAFLRGIRLSFWSRGCIFKASYFSILSTSVCFRLVCVHYVMFYCCFGRKLSMGYFSGSL